MGEVIRAQPKGQDMISDGWPASQCAACKQRDLCFFLHLNCHVRQDGCKQPPSSLPPSLSQTQALLLQPHTHSGGGDGWHHSASPSGAPELCPEVTLPALELANGCTVAGELDYLAK